MPIGEGEEHLPRLEIEHAAGGIVRRAHVEELRARPYFDWNALPVMHKAAGRIRVDVVRSRAGKQRSAFVDLIERIGRDDGRLGSARVDDGLPESEQRL